MVAPSNYNIEVESILGGLESALARGQPLEKAMSSFRNAGYKEKNIEEAVKKFQGLHRRRFQELEVTQAPQKEIVGAVANTSPDGYRVEKTDEEKQDIGKPRALVTAKTREKLIEQYEREKAEIDIKNPPKRIKQEFVAEDPKKVGIDQDLKEEEAALEKKAGEVAISSEEKRRIPKKSKKFKRQERVIQKASEIINAPKKTQVVSGYGNDAVAASENFKEAINEMMRSLGQLSAPQQIVPQRGGREKTQVINKISNYGMKPPTPVNKAVTFLLIFLLILLLGVLAAVFFFREELIDLFNTFTLEYLLPLL